MAGVRLSRVSYCLFIFFFFQAEDGIRDYKVTGVQTCALPICLSEERADQRLNLEAQKIALAERRVKLLEENQQSAKEKLSAVVAKGGLSPETLDRKSVV